MFSNRKISIDDDLDLYLSDPLSMRWGLYNLNAIWICFSCDPSMLPLNWLSMPHVSSYINLISDVNNSTKIFVSTSSNSRVVYVHVDIFVRYLNEILPGYDIVFKVQQRFWYGNYVLHEHLN